MKLSKNKKISIVLPKEPSSVESFAAQELKKYLSRIFSLECETVGDDADAAGALVIIGNPKRNKKCAEYVSRQEFDAAVPGPEGMFIRAFDSALVLAGSTGNEGENDRGTLYAVYEFLERYLGVSFAAYGKAGTQSGEYIPTLSEFSTDGVCYVKARRDIPYRAACVQYSSHGEARNYKLDPEFVDWLCKNRYNHIYTWCGVYENFKVNGMLDAIVKRGIILKVGHHDALDTLLPQRGNEYFPEHYFETHPEYYKLTESGERFELVNHWGQMILCSRNDEMIAQLAKNLITWFKKNPHVKVFALCNQDGDATIPQCCCEMCRPYSKIENYTYMINEVAKRVRRELPDVRIDFLVYSDLWSPPENVKMEANVAANESTWHSSGLRTTGKPDGSCLSHTFFEENLLGWKKLGLKVTYYDYFMGVYGGRQRIVPMADEIQAMFKRFEECGIDGTESQIEVYNLWNNIFNHYTFGRTGYDTSLSMEDNLLRFTRLFGEGAPLVADVVRHLEDTLDGQCEIMEAGRYLMENINKDMVYDLFERALAQTKEPTCRNNIRLFRMAVRYSDLDSRVPDSKHYRMLKHYDIEGRGELLYMRDNFESYLSLDGFGIDIPVDAEYDEPFTPDKWYIFD